MDGGVGGVAAPVGRAPARPRRPTGASPGPPMPRLGAPQTQSAPPPPARPALGDGMKLAAAVMSPRRAEEAEGPPGSPARLV